MFELNQVSLDSEVGSGIPILQAISFQIDPGEVVGLVGPSGSGKTSLLRLLNRLQDATAGEITFEGRPIQTIPVLELRRQVMLVGQESNLLEMSVREALRYPLQLRGLKDSDITQRVQGWIERLQIPLEWLDRSALELSVGQRQRVAGARGLLIEPAVLLLDEPTSSQDIGQAERLLGQAVDLAKTRSSAVIMANHQLEWVQQFCQRVLYLHQGQLLGDWPATQVDWAALRQRIATTERQEQEEWGE